MFTMNIMKNKNFIFSNSTRARNLFTMYNILLLIMVAILSTYIITAFSRTIVGNNTDICRGFLGNSPEIKLSIILIAVYLIIAFIFFVFVCLYSKKGRTYK